MAITASELIRRALQMKQDGLDAHEIGRRLVEIAQANGHVQVRQAGREASTNSVAIKLIDTGVTVYFDGRNWGATLEGKSASPMRPADGCHSAAWPSRAMSDSWPPIRVSRAAVLTLWATIVAERLGHPSETALTLGRAVCRCSARAKARRLGFVDDEPEAEERRAVATALKTRVQTIRLLGKDISVLTADDGTLRADNKGKLASPRSVASYVVNAFGNRLDEARTAMEALADMLPPEELNRVGFRLYERFRPDVSSGATGWGAKGELRLERVMTVWL